MPRRVKVAPRRASKYLPNASTMGYGKYKASPGDVITYKEQRQGDQYVVRTARVIGIIDETDHDGETGVGLLLILTLSDDHSFASERWIPLDDIVTCTPVEHARHFLSWFMAAEPTELLQYRNEDLETRIKAHYRKA